MVAGFHPDVQRREGSEDEISKSLRDFE